MFNCTHVIILETSPRNTSCKEMILPSAVILRIDFTVRNWARSCYVIRRKKFPDLASTRFRVHSGFKNIHCGERIHKVPDSPANSPVTCGRKIQKGKYWFHPSEETQHHATLIWMENTLTPLARILIANQNLASSILPSSTNRDKHTWFLQGRVPFLQTLAVKHYISTDLTD